VKDPTDKTPGCDVIYDFIEQAPKPETVAAHDSAPKVPPKPSVAVALGFTTILEFVEDAKRPPSA
jgi:hypothetical protein